MSDHVAQQTGNPASTATGIAALLRSRAARTGRTAAQTDLLPLLLAIQASAGFVDDEHVRQLADALNLSRAEVHGVASFYPDIVRRTGQGNPELPQLALELCASEACQARGANALLAATANDARVRRVYCLGNCACGPSARVGERILAHLTSTELAMLLAQVPNA